MGKPVKRCDECLLREMRDKHYCECCGIGTMDVQVHHIEQKGMGGWKRIDVRINLLALCWCCHAAFHAGRINRAALEAIVARRENTTVEAIRETIRRIKRGEDNDS